MDRWETPKALAIIIVGAVVLSAASHLVDWLHPVQPLVVIIRMEP